MHDDDSWPNSKTRARDVSISITVLFENNLSVHGDDSWGVRSYVSSYPRVSYADDFWLLLNP